MTQYQWLYTVQVEPRTFVVSEERLEIQFFDAAKPVLMEEIPKQPNILSSILNLEYPIPL